MDTVYIVQSSWGTVLAVFDTFSKAYDWYNPRSGETIRTMQVD